jgi:hypothetical protein
MLPLADLPADKLGTKGPLPEEEENDEAVNLGRGGAVDMRGAADMRDAARACTSGRKKQRILQTAQNRRHHCGTKQHCTSCFISLSTHGLLSP